MSGFSGRSIEDRFSLRRPPDGAAGLRVGCVAGLVGLARLMVWGGLLYGFFARRFGSRCRFGRFVLGLPGQGM